MAKNKTRRLTIGILFNFRKGWMGGIIYIINLVNALTLLDDDDQPEIILFYNADLEEFVNDFKYPHLTVVKWKFEASPIRGFIKSWLSGKNKFVDDIVREYDVNGIYPLNDWPLLGKKMLERGVRVVGWIPDLQHKFYPKFFDWKRVFMREQRIKFLLRNSNDLVVSSRDVESHFRKFYKIKPSLNIHVVRFVSKISDFNFSGIEDIRRKYKIPDCYFIVSNQFTNHKNHLVVLKAILLAKKQNKPVHFVFTGKMEFKGNENYIAQIRQHIQENELEPHVSMLGVIPRQEQLTLMKHARAIVQPSLFEGWSTVIEDAKTLNVPVVASDLEVNIEQLGENGIFFPRHDAVALADLLVSYQPQVLRYEEYDTRVKNFAKTFVSIFRRTT
jgi:glycosyltransferase involved in cell wall biosynthesis